jgi:transposase InsO family protein
MVYKSERFGYPNEASGGFSMPWKESTLVDQRKEFIAAFQAQEISFSALCRYFNISRPTGYKWVVRYLAEGEAGLADESRAPMSQPHRTPEPVQSRILTLRAEHPTWGPKKLRHVLAREDPRARWPAASTIGELLRREGLTHPRPPRRRTPPREQPLAHAEQPNQVWCADFKGWFLCRNGERCDPLTLTDAYSRFLLRCRAVPKTDGSHVRAVLESAFREYGLPEAIRTDNGPPFASTGLAGLSRLSVWWIRLGIRPERIDPGCPQQNGRHERFHLTLKTETASPPQATLSLQQRAFLDFEREYNRIRPHEALGQLVPAAVYRVSSRAFPLHLPDPVYPFVVTRRRVSAAGHFGWRSRQIYVSVLLEGQDVALRALDDDLFEVLFGPLLLGWLDAPSATFTPNRPPPRRSRTPGAGI